MKTWLALAVAALAVMVSSEAYAGKMLFGWDNTLYEIADVSLTGAEGEDLVLVHEVKKYFFIAGVWVKDAGYALAIKDKLEEDFYDFPAAEEVVAYQAEGLLPNPLPSYKIPFIEYIFGYSLWLILGAIGIYYGIKFLILRRTVEPVTTSNLTS